MEESTSVLENLSKEPLPTTEVLRESRGLDAYSPIIYWVGWIAILYFVLYIIAVYIGPAIFGSRSNPPFYYGGRSLRTTREIHESLLEKLTGDVLPATEKHH